MAFENVKVIILVDNQAAQGLTAEHGLSLWIEAGFLRILFDTGQGAALPVNAEKLEISLDQADILVLSHGHYDHAGGLSHVLKVNRKISVYCHPKAVKLRCSVRGGSARFIQMPDEAIVALNKAPLSNMHWVEQPVMISPDIGITGPIPRNTNFEDTGGPFFLDPEGRLADSIIDDQALWINTLEGIVVCVGCCHAGLINTLNYVRRLSGVSAIRAVIGGFHLVSADENRMAQTILALRSLHPEKLIPCHCTGEKALRELEKAFEGRVLSAEAGRAFHF
ncbi:MAG: MBL fold metallo-hydrolase [Desulfobacterales bacterium]|nr:MBL fold metallo-hydrolase [Desulfobacterales bacterium]MDD3081373.1 MBL fold metallo-hydrolase [Desulfobacterales bacterium]MDD3950032.1 MBL fold metallo-hydrolase [Desulfobacterales bacterium]MDD4464653.1 MBL fold metallo-hydrolase [Desulfobacterales bacterium]MDY0377480.1 MBL fold metallo-hydrolase [Desulfobacterales bacterium]